MIKKNYTPPVLEVVEIGFGALQCASPLQPDGISKHDDWVPKENDYDI